MAGTIENLGFWGKLEADFEAGINFLAADILPVAGLVCSCVPGIPGIVPVVISKLPALIAEAEKMFSGDGKGAVKKEYVMSTAKLLVADIADVSTGGQKDTWETEIAPKVGIAVDMMVSIVNKYATTASAPPIDTNAVGNGIPG